MTTGLAIAVVYVAGVLLAVSGIAKLRDPRPTAQSLYTAGWPSATAIIRAFGLAEVAGFVLLLARGRPGAIAEAALYGVFFLFIASTLIRKVSLASCGCAGATETPPSWAHAIMNALVTVAAAAVAVTRLGSVDSIVSRLGGLTAVFLIAAAATAWLTYLTVTAAPRLFARPVPALTSEEV